MRISQNTFSNIKKEFGRYSSWAIWSPQILGRSIKSGVEDLSIFDAPDILDYVHSNYIIVGLNISGPIVRTFGNFHSDSSYNNDYKMRHAFTDTPLWGAYMTDILKDVCEVDSQKIAKNMKDHVSGIGRHADIFARELEILGAQNAKIITLGGLTDRLTRFVLNQLELTNDVIQIFHYAHYIGPEKYRLHVHERILT